MTERDVRDDTLEAIAPGLAAARDKWWQVWEEANPDGRGGSTLGYDIEQGWDSAWDCIEQFLTTNQIRLESEHD